MRFQTVTHLQPAAEPENHAGGARGLKYRVRKKQLPRMGLHQCTQDPVKRKRPRKGFWIMGHKQCTESLEPECRIGRLPTRLATSICRLRHDQMEQGPTEPHAGRSAFLLSSGGAGGGYY